MRIAIGAISHETNTFSNHPTTLKEFENYQLLEGREIIQFFRGTATTLGGVIDRATVGIELVPTIAAYAVPSGIVTSDALQELVKRLVNHLCEQEPSVHGILLALHGAMVSELAEDGEAYVLRAVRQSVGPELPIAVVLDSHANITPEMAGLADLLIGYDTYPHLDMADRSAEALRLLLALVERRISPTKSLRQLPLISPVNGQQTVHEPMLSIMDFAHEMEQEPEVINVTIASGFPYSDVPFAGFSVLVTTNNNQSRADRIADLIAGRIWEQRAHLQVSARNVEEAVHSAMAAHQGPVVLADQGDNPGAGGTGDGTALLWALLDLGARDAAFALIADTNAVRRSIELGLGQTIELSLGGKLDRRGGYPVDVSATVQSITDGRLILEGPMATGLRVELGKTLVLNAAGRHGGNLEIIVTERAVQPFDLAFFRSQGIEPTRKKILAVKSSVHFRAAFEPIASEIIEVATPGITTPELGFFEFKRIRRPIYPLDHMSTWE